LTASKADWICSGLTVTRIGDLLLGTRSVLR
jgi:hypothetical protein